MTTLPVSLHSTDPDYTRERYSVAQAALYLGVSTDVVYAEARAKRIAHRRSDAKRPRTAPRVRKTSGRLHFAQADLDAWRTARRVEVANLQLVPSKHEGITLPEVRRFA